MQWFIDNRRDLRSRSPTWNQRRTAGKAAGCWPFRRGERLERVLRYMLDENEFLSPYGIRSLSRVSTRTIRTFCQLGRPGAAGRL